MTETRRASGTTVGLTADTHDDIANWPDVHAKVAAAFAGVERILHCGDITTPALLDRLEEIAPVTAVRSAGDPPADSDPRLNDGPIVIEAGGVSVGLVCSIADTLPYFDEPVAAVVHGGTHEASIEDRDGVLYVNPGSPTLADTTTVAVLILGDGPPRAEIVAI